MFEFLKRRKEGPVDTRPPLEIRAAVRTHPGYKRNDNEDSSLFLRPRNDRAGRRLGVLALVADGMGGHVAGKRASQIAVEVISRRYYESDGTSPASLEASIRAASAEILQAAASDPGLDGMGTTIVALAIEGYNGHIAHIGDSRVYLWRDKGLYRLTEDHSVVMEMVRLGRLTAEEARHHPERNVISRALGHAGDAGPSQQTMELRPADRFLLCSDGLTDMVTDEQIGHLLETADPGQAADALIEAALAGGGNDNITALIVDALAESSQEIVPETRTMKVIS